ncbi:Solute carrier family 12 member 9 [Eumeta japonica]|uniref:Solute carrier family 12 member 9 n=1 Tax=Eumeta variegata TaxID=151549 RepID=A0A4C1SGJ5_EUMVA|nr:Solute carrier family 12 member 9 [Eumeta japonica]
MLIRLVNPFPLTLPCSLLGLFKMAETLDPLSPSVNSSQSQPVGLLNKLRRRFTRGTLPRAADAYYDLEAETILSVDASSSGLGAVLAQRQAARKNVVADAHRGRTGVFPNTGGGDCCYVEFGEFRSEPTGVKKVGTFAGVFCPVVLSMFSALIFIRMVMISRTLGPEFGGAIGTLFFFANIASSALCISACTEALVENFGPKGYLVDGLQGLPDSAWWRFFYRSILNAVGLAISLAGASLFARTSLAIWATMVVCLSSAFISFFVVQEKDIPIPDTNKIALNMTNATYTGLNKSTLLENLYPEYGIDYTTANGEMVDFASVFGVLFTGVTGVMAGANMSGELKNPARSIPIGTLAALLFIALSYVALSLLTASTCSRALLQNNYVYLLPINVWAPFIAVGMLMATFSAGLSNLIGASRVLEALAKDNIFGFFLRPMVSRSGNPVLAVIMSWLLVQLGIMAGSLNAIAQVNSVLFITSYFAINLACLGLDLASAPNFRPSFKHFSWMTSLSGLMGCAAVVFALRPAHAAGAALACLSLVVALHFWSPAAEDPKWGSLGQALIFHQVRKYLLLLDPRREHVKFWRPQMLLLVSSPRQAAPLIDFVNDQKKGGLYVLGHVRLGQLEGNGDPLEKEHKYWMSLIDHLKVKAFVELCLAESIRSGAAHLTRLSGLGAMKPDTVLLGFRDEARPRDFFTEKDRSLKYIDVWLVDTLTPSSEDPFTVRALFTLQLAAVVRSSRGWQHLGLRVYHTAVLTEDDRPTMYINEGGSTRTVGDEQAAVPPRGGRSARERLEELLKLLRISGDACEVRNWPHRENAQSRIDRARSISDTPSYNNISDEYMERACAIDQNNDSRMAQCLVNTAGGVVLPNQVFSNSFSPEPLHADEHYHVEE